VSEQIGGRAGAEEEAVEESRPEVRETEGETEAKQSLTAELGELENRHRRALADLDNYRKRSRREIERRSFEQREALLREWLEVVDNIERALSHADHSNPLHEGLRAVLEQVEGVMRRQGVHRFGAAGDPFDPTLHQAVGILETEEEPTRTVVEVVRGGYALGDRVLRPAEVVVAQPRKTVS